MLKNKVALVTGGGRGIGRAVCLEMAASGADIAIIYSGNEAAASETAGQVRALGRRAEIYRCDVADFQQAKDTTAAVIKDFGGVDILVNNAGITRDGLILTMKPEDFAAVIGVSLVGAFNMTKCLYQQFMKRRWGRIINISSVSGLSGTAGQANYASAKAGIIGLTKTTARELASRGVTCNAIAPGYIETDMTAVLPEKVKEAAVANIPSARMGQPKDVAAAAVFLASDGAAYITGEVLRVDGGMCM